MKLLFVRNASFSAVLIIQYIDRDSCRCYYASMRTLFILIMTLVLTVISVQPILAVNIITPEPEPTSTASAEYILPYPGMLPDNPLYKLKIARDRLMLLFIRNPASRAEKYISLADRQLFEALKVAEKEKISLAVHTAFKAEHQMTLAVSELQRIVTPEQFDDIKDKALLASQKHRELLAGIADRAKNDADSAAKVETIMQFSLQNDESIRKTDQERQQKELFEELLEEDTTEIPE